jgi:hypothetical protein
MKEPVEELEGYLGTITIGEARQLNELLDKIRTQNIIAIKKPGHTLETMIQPEKI